MEFILIVAGVLIALQVDNWNEERIQHQKEIIYLEEIRKSLVSDLSELEKVFSFNELKDSCINETLKIMASREDGDDYSMQIAGLFYTMGHFEHFYPNFIAYNTMISAESVNLIRNDSLRMSLANYYGREIDYETGTQEGVKAKTRQFVDRVIPKIITNDIARFYSGLELDYDFPNFSFDDFRRDPAIFHEIMVMKINIQDQNLVLEAAREEIEGILRLMKKSSKLRM
ncbi:MAG: DUF6090 family protein [Bacteroidota bacterium]